MRSLLILMLLFSLNLMAEYQPEDLDDSSYRVEHEVDSGEVKSREVAAEIEPEVKPGEKSPKKPMEEAAEVEREMVPFWDYQKEKF